MRFTLRAALAVLLPLMLAASAAGQTPQGTSAIIPVGSVLPADVVRDLPLGDTVYSILENTQSEVISDRFNSGGINVGGDARLGGFLGSWSQTMFRVGDVDVSDPMGSGAPLLFPDASLWQSVNVATGLMPADINTPGLAVTLEPRRAGSTWLRMLNGVGSGGGLAVGAPAGQPAPIARLSDFARGSGLIAGPLSDRVGLVAAGTWTRGAALSREQLASTRSTNGSAFAHVVFTPQPGREWRTLGWVQRTETPFEYWQAFRNPTATTQSNAIHLQSTLERRPADGARWRVFAGFTQRDRTNDAGANEPVLERISGGPVSGLVDAAADTTARRLSLGGRFAPSVPAGSRHRVSFGADLGYASTATSGLFRGTVRELVNGIPARIWTYGAPGVATSNRAVTTVSAFATDVITLSPRLMLDTGVRAEVVHGSAEGAATAVNWLSLLPHAYLRWQVGAQRALVLGYARSAHALNQTWLSFGDPAASVATVAAAGAPAVVVTRVGPGTGGTPSFSGIDADLKRPYTDEFVVGLEKRRSEATRYSLTGIARRQGQTLGVVNTLATPGDYSTISIPDAGKDWVGPDDDRTLVVYNRLPASFGRDAYLVTNPDQQAPTAFALRMQWEYTTQRLFMLFGATASAAMGPVSSRGYGPLENDQDQPGEIHTNPNAASYARGRLFNDRAFTIKWATLYRFPWDVTVAGIARYQDGQPFSRLVVVPTLNQGVEGIQAYPNAGSRYTFIGTLDLRLQKGIRAGATRVDAIVDAYNLFTRNNSVEEDIVTSPAFRTPIAIQPPRSVHIGLRVTF
jgi:hypothetical protein